MAGKDKVKNIAEKVDLLIRPVIDKLGYILWDVEYKKEGREYNLIVTIDKEGTDLTLDDCVTVTDAINPILDEADPIPDSYCLEVSSAGLERELKKPEHFARYIGCEAEVKLFAPTEALPKLFTGVIVNYGEDSILFTVDGKEVSVERAQIASAKNKVDYAEIFKKDN